MIKNVSRVSALLVAVMLVGVTVTTALAATVYYYFGYLYTYISNEKVSLYGIDDPEMDGLFVPATLNNRSLVDIRNNAFKNNTNLRYLEFAGAVNLERIGSFAFSGCTAISGEISIPSNVKTIETAAFENCTSIETVVYNASCGYVPTQCFNGCTLLSSVTLNDSVKSIGNYAFSGCSGLTYMVIPASVTEISSTAFQNDENLTLGVWYGSYGYEYAVENGIDYTLLDGVLLGDVNADENVDVADVTTIQQFIAELADLDGIYRKAADVNNDGDVNIADATAIQMYVAEYDIPYPIGEPITK